jgi:hypothetical protein
MRLSTVLTIAAVGVPAGVFLLFRLERLGDRFFPPGAFVFGDGEERYEFDDFVRKGVGIGFVVSVVSSLVAAMLLAA